MKFNVGDIWLLLLMHFTCGKNGTSVTNKKEMHVFFVLNVYYRERKVSPKCCREK